MTRYRRKEVGEDDAAIARVGLVAAAMHYKDARRRRDQLIIRSVYDGVLTRQEIANAVGLSKPRIDQIARGE